MGCWTAPYSQWPAWQGRVSSRLANAEGLQCRTRADRVLYIPFVQPHNHPPSGTGMGVELGPAAGPQRSDRNHKIQGRGGSEVGSRYAIA